jgi:hypothetical protein
MLETITLLSFLPIGVMLGFSKMSFSKVPLTDFLILSFLWMAGCFLIDSFAPSRTLFYSNDQETFVSASIQLVSCVLGDCDQIDFRYLTQSVPSAVFIILGLEPLNTLKGLNYLSWIMIYRMYITAACNKSLNTNFWIDRYLKFIFLGPTILLFSIVGNRDLLVILLFCFFGYFLTKKKFISVVVLIFLMLTLRFQAAFVLIVILIISLLISVYRYRFITSLFLAALICIIATFTANIILSPVMLIYGFDQFEIASILSFPAVAFAVSNIFGLGFLFVNNDVSSNSLTTLLAMRLIFFDTILYFIFAIPFFLTSYKHSMKFQNDVNIQSAIVAVFIFYSVVSYSLNFFSTRQNLPFIYMLILIHLGLQKKYDPMSKVRP